MTETPKPIEYHAITEARRIAETKLDTLRKAVEISNERARQREIARATSSEPSA